MTALQTVEEDRKISTVKKMAIEAKSWMGYSFLDACVEGTHILCADFLVDAWPQDILVGVLTHINMKLICYYNYNKILIINCNFA